MTRPRVVVLGGGITGLSAALRLAESADVTLIEATDRLGGKIRTGADGIEDGAEQFLMRDPATGGPSGAARLATTLGLPIVHPAIGAAGLYTGGELRPMPGGTLMGIPSSTLDGFRVEAARDLDLGTPVLPPGADVAVGRLVRERLGDDVVDRLVDPLLGGVYAGRADLLSLATTMPALHGLLTTEHTLGAAVAQAQQRSRAHSAGAGPVFGAVAGGLSGLVDAAEAAAVRAGVQIRRGVRVTALRRTGEGMEILHGEEWLAAAGVLLAVPAIPAARMLTFLAPEASTAIAELEYASLGLVALVLPACELPEASGFLVPATEGLSIKAATFLSAKWPSLGADGEVVIRASLGRHGDSTVLQRADDDLVDIVRSEVSVVIDRPLPQPLRTRVTRWGGALPQYAPGHLDRVAAARAALAGLPITLAGAAYDGIGIPACVASGEAAADLLTESMI
ncbi:oxygen-dependent protoporphyrinogen oxidase [Allocatelliglobosispora scoriae]|uniref:Coproporphyrinogen III oxidase n=1 Tax=Allocatelliglobosispora scoriae TaxID=643052 RepID=A0A841C063_9ACTN|nr:protoporphyrinogen oxidase [Allocatelliglobosispora scoriae]MBB5872432.1 oxygen-dependent protoporphyrinogen oxidase [Allocatelliglobosispora scoriae]